jgi:preprotein translocase subunit SecA
MEMLEDVVDELVNRYTDARSTYVEWDLAGLAEALWGQFGIHFDFEAGPEKERTREGITELIVNAAQQAYEEKERSLNPDIMRQLEKYIMLQAVDNQWKDHLLSMDHLKEGIGLRGYGQRDPLKEYQREGYELFMDMSQRIREETVRNLFLVKIVQQEDFDELAPSREQEMHLSRGGNGEPQGRTQRRKQEKVGRNAPCPCGSGKKYKKCCGKGS